MRAIIAPPILYRVNVRLNIWFKIWGCWTFHSGSQNVLEGPLRPINNMVIFLKTFIVCSYVKTFFISMLKWLQKMCYLSMFSSLGHLMTWQLKYLYILKVHFLMISEHILFFCRVKIDWVLIFIKYFPLFIEKLK